MAENRIQKLLFNEYSDFEDIVLIESPFAQTTKDGVGVRQVQMGLTPTKLILAGDILEKGMHFDPTVPIDPHIGTLELLSLFPVECVNMSVYRRKNRNTLKAHFCNDQVIYFELAASLKRDMYWNLWCERIKFLNPEEQSLSTHSETSVGSTSVSTSTQYKSSRMENTKRVNKCAWDCKDIYLGENFGQGETVIERKPRGLPHIPREKDICNKRTKGKHAEVCLVNRFGQGISENCCTNLFLPVQVYITPKFDDMETIDTAESEELMVVNNMQMLNQTMDTFYVANNIEVKHRRRYGIAPMGILFHALGSISVQKPQLFSLQLKRCCSEVYISYVESEIEEMLGFPKRLLTSSVSCENLIEEKRSDKQLDNTPRLLLLDFKILV
ncbi:hypothetical protein O3M35_006395 [Rhynocoris fuscipes]|uniref:Uncharacterized protein n=1 Tax=Rhynocoris fuscipes TaxID=488301 RepID=A0AAW1DEY2_9HEMI